MYYLLVVQNDTTCAAYSYQTYNESLSAYHAELAYRADGRTKTMCAILNSFGTMLKSEIYDKNEEGAEE